MKNNLLVLIFIILAFSVAFAPITAYAENIDDSPIAITVVVPPRDNNQPSPTNQPDINIYPVQVWESREDGRRQIIRVYELGINENPADIPREPFERDGFRFELSEIVRREIPAYDVREYEETIAVNTETNDLSTVVALLSPTLDYLTEDGYFGVLVLDILSIHTESQGTASSSFTETKTREFPHLSSPDTSLVPRTITDNGRTYNLANVEWRTQSATAIDYNQVASTYTAVATYTRTGTRTSNIGYTTTAMYRGQISRIGVGKTEFTASFIGIPIVTPTLNPNPPQTTTETPLPAPSPSPTTIENVIVEQVQVGGIVIEMETVVPTPSPITEDEPDEDEVITDENETRGSSLRGVLIFLLIAGGMVLAYFFGKKGKTMLGLLKKTSCFLLVCVMMFGISQYAYAAELPQYGFGSSNNENVVYFNETQNTEAEISTHFNPSVSTNAENASVYNYGDFIGTLTVERQNRSVSVFAGATNEAMNRGCGHFDFTGLNVGNTAFIGHNRGRAGFFSFVKDLREGDIITLEADGVTRSYAVSLLYTVDDNDFSPLMQFGDNRLTLVTCVENQRNQRRIAVAFILE